MSEYYPQKYIFMGEYSSYLIIFMGERHEIVICCRIEKGVFMQKSILHMFRYIFAYVVLYYHIYI